MAVLAAASHGTVSAILWVATAVVAIPAVTQGVLMSLVALVVRADGSGDSAQERAPARTATSRVLLCALVAMALLAALGVFLYARQPDVASYQASTLLIAPFLVVVLIYLHRHLFSRVRAAAEWGAALALAGVGAGGYAITGSTQWWNWGQLAIVPLAFLVAVRGVKTRRPGPATYPTFRDGPWGPP